MASVEKLSGYINQMKSQGDWQPMRDAVRAIVHRPGLTVAAFAHMPLLEMSRCIQDYVAAIERAQEKNGDSVANVPSAMLAAGALA